MAHDLSHRFHLSFSGGANGFLSCQKVVQLLVQYLQKGVVQTLLGDLVDCHDGALFHVHVQDKILESYVDVDYASADIWRSSQTVKVA